MKKHIILLLTVLSGMFPYKQIYSQVDQSGLTGHDRVGTYFVGWGSVAGTSGTLEIKNNWNSDINFSTNGTQKATILSGGNIGIGTTSPNNLVHAYKSGTSADLYMQWSNGNTTYYKTQFCKFN